MELEHKNNKKRCRFFSSSQKWTGFLGVPDIDVLNIIKVNIHSVGTENTGDGDNHCANKPVVQREDTRQETDRAEKCYTNTDSISRSSNKNKPMVDN